MNCEGMTREQREDFERRQTEIVSMELTFMQIKTLPITYDCPPEERLA